MTNDGQSVIEKSDSELLQRMARKIEQLEKDRQSDRNEIERLKLAGAQIKEDVDFSKLSAVSVKDVNAFIDPENKRPLTEFYYVSHSGRALFHGPLIPAGIKRKGTEFQDEIHPGVYYDFKEPPHRIGSDLKNYYQPDYYILWFDFADHPNVTVVKEDKEKFGLRDDVRIRQSHYTIQECLDEMNMKILSKPDAHFSDGSDGLLTAEAYQMWCRAMYKSILSNMKSQAEAKKALSELSRAQINAGLVGATVGANG